MLESKIPVFIVDRGYKQYEIAEKMGMSKQQFNAVVKGRAYMTIEKYFKLAKILECKVDELFIYKEE